jgi:FlaA1/EpsC-like NDP-sugar epimerase
VTFKYFEYFILYFQTKFWSLTISLGSQVLNNLLNKFYVFNSRITTVTKKALITGLTGQDGSYLAELLLTKGYQVFGLVRRSSSSNLERVNHLSGDIQILSGDLLDQSSLMDVIAEAQPDEIYNLASQSYVPLSWDSTCSHC